MLGSDKNKAPETPKFEGTQPHIAIVASREMRDLTDPICKGAKDRLQGLMVTSEVFEVNSVADLGAGLAMAMRSGRFEGYVAIGALVESETGEDVIFAETIRAIGALGIAGHAVSTAILYDRNRKSLTKRITARKADPGGSAAEATLQLVALARATQLPVQQPTFRPASEYIQMADTGQG